MRAMPPPSTLKVAMSAVAGGVLFLIMSATGSVHTTSTTPLGKAEGHALAKAARERFAAGDLPGARALAEECLKLQPNQTACLTVLNSARAPTTNRFAKVTVDGTPLGDFEVRSASVRSR
jgi:hypothetical protein